MSSKGAISFTRLSSYTSASSDPTMPVTSRFTPSSYSSYSPHSSSYRGTSLERGSYAPLSSTKLASLYAPSSSLTSSYATSRPPLPSSTSDFRRRYDTSSRPSPSRASAPRVQPFDMSSLGQMTEARKYLIERRAAENHPSTGRPRYSRTESRDVSGVTDYLSPSTATRSLRSSFSERGSESRSDSLERVSDRIMNFESLAGSPSNGRSSPLASRRTRYDAVPTTTPTRSSTYITASTPSLIDRGPSERIIPIQVEDSPRQRRPSVSELRRQFDSGLEHRSSVSDDDSSSTLSSGSQPSSPTKQARSSNKAAEEDKTEKEDRPERKVRVETEEVPVPPRGVVGGRSSAVERASSPTIIPASKYGIRERSKADEQERAASPVAINSGARARTRVLEKPDLSTSPARNSLRNRKNIVEKTEAAPSYTPLTNGFRERRKITEKAERAPSPVAVNGTRQRKKPERPSSPVSEQTNGARERKIVIEQDERVASPSPLVNGTGERRDSVEKAARAASPVTNGAAEDAASGGTSRYSAPEHHQRSVSPPPTPAVNGVQEHPTANGTAEKVTSGAPLSRQSTLTGDTSGSQSRTLADSATSSEEEDEEEESASDEEDAGTAGGATVAYGPQDGLTGLRNIGNTCFMNSVLQCLSNTRALHDYILRGGYETDINTTTSGMKGALMQVFASLMTDLWKPGEESDRVLTTAPFKSQIQKFAPRFMGYQQQDAQEFLRYLLEGLHEDVNRVITRPKPITEEIDENLSESQKAIESWKRFMRFDNSKFVDLFVGQLKSTLRCTVCGHPSVTFDPFWDLSLPIPAKTGQVRLQACFELFNKEEVLDGDEKPTCSKCQKRQKCTKSFSIQKFPRILVVHLKRFSPMERYRGKLNSTVDFPLCGLDLSPYSETHGNCRYNLYGVANHSGTLYSGHYTAYCKHPYSAEWHEYNDSRVRNVSLRNVVSSEAYVLFFEQAGASSL